MQEVLYLVLELNMPHYSQAIFPVTNPVIEVLCQKFELSLVSDEITMLCVDVRNAGISWGFLYTHADMIKVL